MSIDYSKSRENAKNFSREADYHELDVSTLNPAFVGQEQCIGSATIDQLEGGVRYPNVQSAISDISNMFPTQVGEVRITTENIAPSGTQQIQRVTVTGNAVNTIVKMYGVDIAVNVGENQDAISTKIKAVLNTLAVQKLAIKRVSAVSGAANKFDVTMLDFNTHSDYIWTDGNVTVSAENLTSAKSGYGQWVLLGEQDIVSAGVTSKMYYWKRSS